MQKNVITLSMESSVKYRNGEQVTVRELIENHKNSYLMDLLCSGRYALDEDVLAAANITRYKRKQRVYNEWEHHTNRKYRPLMKDDGMDADRAADMILKSGNLTVEDADGLLKELLRHVREVSDEQADREGTPAHMFADNSMKAITASFGDTKEEGDVLRN